MNILHIANHLNIGGISSYILTLTVGLKKRGHNIYIASSGGLLVERIKEAGAVYLPIPIKTKKEISPKILASIIKLRRENRRCKFDIIHAHTRTTQVLAASLSKSLGIPYVVTCHGFFRRRILRRVFPCWGNKVIAISQQVKEHLAGDFKVEENKIIVIHNGIDVNRFIVHSSWSKEKRKRELGLTDNPVIGIVARLSDVKGHAHLIKAMRDVLNKFPHAQLLIVGEGKTKDELVKLTNSLGIAKSVFFKPEVFDTREVLSAMDVFVMPSLKEGLGLGLMEAMASGLPVVGSDVGGIKSLINNNNTGLLAHPADSIDLADKISVLLNDETRRSALGAAAQTFILENFSADKMVLETEKVYLECVK